jgi:MSHA biogenesis protein MshN
VEGLEICIAAVVGVCGNRVDVDIMSLINQMLKDLEQRNASADHMKPLSGEVRSVSGVRKTSDMLQLVLMAVLLLALAGAMWWKYYLPAAKVINHPVPVVKVEKPQPAPQSQPVPTPPVAASAEVQTQGIASDAHLPGLDKELRTTPAPSAQQEKKSKPVAVSSAEMATPPMGSPKPAAEQKPKEKSAIKPLPASAGSSFKSVNPQQKSDNLYKQAVSMLQQGRVAEARATLVQSLEGNPYDHNARQLLVGLLVENKHNDEATGLLQEGVRLAPEQTGFVMALARLQVEAGDLKTALQTMEQGAKYAADDADYQGFYAALLQRDERHEEAVPHYLSALKSDPSNTSWLVGVGISLQEQGKFADAREAFDRARQTGQLSPELTDFVEQRLRQLKDK